MKRYSSSHSSSTHLSANLKKHPAAPKGAALVQRKKPTNARSPLRDLNGVASCSSGTNASSSSSTSTSVEAPNGCLRFFRSNPSSSAKARTPFSNRSGALPGAPKSAPAPKPKKNPNPSKCSAKSNNCAISGVLEEESLKKRQDYELKELNLCSDSAANCTPVSKTPRGSGLGLGMQCRVYENNDDNETRIKTPPIEASVSPEIQCSGLNVLSAAKMASGKASLPPCYGAGHVLSGITDKRKCKPRGILTLRDNDLEYNTVPDIIENADANDDGGSFLVWIGKTSGLSPVPLPCEASIHWLSPCPEDGEKDEKSKSPAHRVQELVLASLSSSPLSLSGTGFSSDVFSKCSLSSSATGCSNGDSKRESAAPRHPSQGLICFQGFLGPAYETSSPSHTTPIFSNSISMEGKKCNFYDRQEDNAFSTGLSGSGNVIRTPNSKSASKNPVEDQMDFDADLVARAFDEVKLSPEHHHHHLSTWDPVNLSNSIDLAQVQKVVDSKAASWVSNSTSDFASSQDPLRISWRDGLASRIFEMDEYDCCRCLSDEEEDPNLKPLHGPDQNSGIRDDTKLGPKQKVNMASDIHSMSIDSMTSNGDRLFASDDSNWNLCYKNHLFDVYSELRKHGNLSMHKLPNT